MSDNMDNDNPPEKNILVTDGNDKKMAKQDRTEIGMDLAKAPGTALVVAAAVVLVAQKTEEPEGQRLFVPARKRKRRL